MTKRWWLLGASLLLTSVIFGRLMVKGGAFAQLSPHFAGQCTTGSGMPGAEDITFHPTLGYAYVSSDDRRASPRWRRSLVQGGIYRYEPETGARPLLTASFKAPFHPHGISLFVDPGFARARTRALRPRLRSRPQRALAHRLFWSARLS
jgi:arylesterase/paraoxonase